MVKKYLGYTIIIIMLMLVTFFGMGPVLFADGSSQERLITFLVVLFIYVLLVLAFRFWRKSMKLKRKN